MTAAKPLVGHGIPLLALVATQTFAAGELRLPAIFGDNMVLQRDCPVPVWGWAEPGSQVTVEFARQRKTSAADKDGKWLVTLDPLLAAAEPRQLVVRSSIRHQQSAIRNVVVGEVWLGSGQSNMGTPLSETEDSTNYAARSADPALRLFGVPETWSRTPNPDIDMTAQIGGLAGLPWIEASSNSVLGFSGVLYHFGRELRKELKVPVGVIRASFGGTPISSWIPREAFFREPALGMFSNFVVTAERKYEKDKLDTIAPMDRWVQEARVQAQAGAPLPELPPEPRHMIDAQGQSTATYNAMIHPLIPFAIRGVLWYHGEANQNDLTYFEEMRALIDSWRSAWKQPSSSAAADSGVPGGDFPVYFVQLPPYGYPQYDALTLPLFRERQVKALSIPNTGMAVTMDVGEEMNIHPQRKAEVGQRLALLALAKTYGRKNLVCSGPMYESYKVEGSAVRVSFSSVGGGLVSRDGKPLTWFQVAGEDKQFVGADARIDGKTVIVSSSKVPKPVAARFGFHKLAMPNLMNKEGLPAAPFRTDTW